MQTYMSKYQQNNAMSRIDKDVSNTIIFVNGVLSGAIIFGIALIIVMYNSGAL